MASKPQKMPKVAKVKDKSPAELQITAEQLLREAKERELEIVPPPPRQKISDPEELQEYRLKKRRAFEDNIRKNRGNISNWIKYAKWEEEQQEIRRARSVYERALDVDHRNITLWLKYAEMEMRMRQVNHARNVWDKAVTILPRANQFWYKYTYMEEMLKNTAGCRQVFERWMEWEPDEQAWLTYIKFELRYKELDRARAIYERFVYVHPEPKYWIKYAHFEENHGYIQSARRVYERAIQFFGDDHLDESLFIAFSKFEEGQKEHDRARVIYRYALDHMPKEKCLTLYNEYTRHEKKYGDKSSIDDVITSKRKFQYEEAVKANPHDYDTWFDYVRMLEADGNVDLIRETYERAIACVPPLKEKRHWRRYIYLWIYYALFEELTTKDIERARQVYQMCLRLIPHKIFTFAEIWLLYGKFEIRQKDLAAARKAMGQAIGMCPKHKLFRGYIDLEIKLREFDRCRKLYEKWAEFDPENCKMWIQFATLEAMLNDADRARGIYELSIAQPRLDMPEYMWKSYIDFEVEQEEWDRVRSLYERLLERTHHVKVWISFAKCEHSMTTEDNIVHARGVFQRANRALRLCQEKEQRLMLLEAWRDFEDEFGDAENEDKVKKLMPRKVTRRRQVTTDDGSQTRWEEYIDYIFPDDEAAKPSLLLLAKAKEWAKKQKEHTENLEEITPEAENPCFEETAEINPDLDRDDSDVEIGSSSESSSEHDEEEEMIKNGRKEKKRRKPSFESSDNDKIASKKKESKKSSYSTSTDEEIEKTKMREDNRKSHIFREERRSRTKKENSRSSESSSDSSSESNDNEK
ncbi:crooked neck-like protein 1 [Panulirus ornatus]|uniref:crooked neck-like protein 1 n=1 Tax=Panulirus ornatus TaxID=150431 RepID=UPI003A8918DA